MFLITGIVGGVLSFGGTWLCARHRPLPAERGGQLLPFLIIITIIGTACGCILPFRADLWTIWIRLLWILAVLSVTAYTDFLSCTIPNRCVAVLLAGFPMEQNAVQKCQYCAAEQCYHYPEPELLRLSLSC